MIIGMRRASMRPGGTIFSDLHIRCIYPNHETGIRSHDGDSICATDWLAKAGRYSHGLTWVVGELSKAQRAFFQSIRREKYS